MFDLDQYLALWVPNGYVTGMDNRATDENRDAFDTLMSAMEAFDQNPNADTRAALGEAKRRHAERTSPRPQAALG